MDRYEVRRKIGQGSFGSVYVTVHRKSRKTLVLKEIKVSRMDAKERQDVAREVELLSKLSHPNIVQYVESFSDNIG
jgi:NIMA (never in mitosis gene a)-related kinase